MTPDGGSEILRAGEAGQWSPYLKIEMEDSMTTGPRGFDKAGTKLYFVDSRGRNTAALTALDLETKKQTVIGEDPKADIGGLLVHPTENNVQAYSANYLRNDWRVVDKSVQGDFDYLRGVAEGEFMIGSRSLDDKKWIVTYGMGNGPVRYYGYGRPTK